MNDKARYLLDCYTFGIEPDGGWIFPKALHQAQLDHTPASLRRVNLLLDEIRAQLNPERASFLARPDARNLCTLLGGYLAAYLEQRHPRARVWPAHAAGGLSPQAWVEAKLFGAPEVPDCTDYVAGLFATALGDDLHARIAQASDADIDEMDWISGEWQPAGGTAHAGAVCYA